MYSFPTLWSAPLAAAAWQLMTALLLAHLAGDFVFQTESMVRNKRQPDTLFTHAVIHAVLAYVAVGRWALWIVPAIVFVGHAAIDAVKARADRQTQAVFWLDQAAHLAVIAVLARLLGGADAPGAWAALGGGGWSATCVLVSGGIICVRVCAVAIGFWVHPYLEELKAAGQGGFAADAVRGLTNGGRTIGQWERALIFLLVVAGLPSGIGFLIAAKSIFRFGELSDRKNRMEAEYITIGTLMSFGVAIAIAYGTLAVVRHAAAW